MTHSEKSTGNEIEGDVSGTSIQAGSIAFNLGTAAKPRRGKAFWCLTGSAAVVIVASVSTLALKLTPPDEQVRQTHAAATASATTSTTSPPAASSTAVAPAPATAARPAPGGTVPRLAGTTPAVSAPVPTTTAPKVAALPPPAPAGDGVRFSGALRFGSFHLDPAQPRDVPESNVWALTPKRLHGDPGYWLAEWHSDGEPGRAECATHLGTNATLDADNVVVGSRVCGKTPEGRIFRIDVTVLDGSAITGQVTVWESV
ncbi:hypothetical protein ACSHWB_42045 [Lentzea sp. HUAS TT2]|uniref:hypothetical protein n=1 Tax=Lentzea sp. HUAS TT2 TaxID=3447454 RepID=UPI003F72267A